MLKEIFKQLYIIVVAIFIVMSGNILANNYGAGISAELSKISNSADREVNKIKRSVDNWNKNILD
ncbi:MAG: hypothetical protein ABGY08_02660 [Gammaproteobacteria bacterium]